MWHPETRWDIQDLFSTLAVPDVSEMSTCRFTSAESRAQGAARMRAYRAAHPGYDRENARERKRRWRARQKAAYERTVPAIAT